MGRSSAIHLPAAVSCSSSGSASLNLHCRDLSHHYIFHAKREKEKKIEDGEIEKTSALAREVELWFFL